MVDEITQAVAAIRRDQASQPLTVSTNQPFASLWLIPRLSHFRERQPDTDVYISADNHIVDLERERIDLAVRYCGEAAAPPGALRLFGERLMPVCSPALAVDRAHPLKRPEDLAHHVLLHIDDERGRFPWLNWSAWLAAIGVDHLTPAGSLRFNLFDQVIQAAIDGQGVALGREPLVDHLVRQRKLVAPFPDRYATPRAYYVVRATHAALRPEAQAFSDWLLEEARADAVDAGAAAKVQASGKRARK